jgi:dephospho-CoA kinase
MDTQEENKSFVIGITGGIGSGKSTVAKIIEDEGFNVIKTDDIAKELMQKNPAVMKKIIREFGSEAYKSNGKLNTEYLAGRVFGDTEEHQSSLDKLNQIVHPPTIDEMMRLTDEYEYTGEKLIFIESSLIFEAELEEGFDYIIVVNSNEENCLKRTMERSNLTREQALNRMKNQIPLKEKSDAADFVIQNDGNMIELEKSVDFILRILKQI